MASRKIKNMTTEDLTAAWVESRKYVPRQPGEYTTKEWAALLGWNKDKTRRVLLKYVEEGTWARRDLGSGREGLLYRPLVKPDMI